MKEKDGEQTDEEKARFWIERRRKIEDSSEDAYVKKKEGGGELGQFNTSTRSFELTATSRGPESPSGRKKERGEGKARLSASRA